MYIGMTADYDCVHWCYGMYGCGMKHEMQSSSIAVSTFHFVDAFPLLNVDACNERKLHSKLAMERAMSELIKCRNIMMENSQVKL